MSGRPFFIRDLACMYPPTNQRVKKRKMAPRMHHFTIMPVWVVLVGEEGGLEWEEDAHVAIPPTVSVSAHDLSIGILDAVSLLQRSQPHD